MFLKFLHALGAQMRATTRLAPTPQTGAPSATDSARKEPKTQHRTANSSTPDGQIARQPKWPQNAYMKNKTKQNKTKQNKTKQNKTKQLLLGSRPCRYRCSNVCNDWCTAFAPATTASHCTALGCSAMSKKV